MPDRAFAELHVHIGGTLEPDLVRSLARRDDVDLPPDDVALARPPAYRDLQEFPGDDPACFHGRLEDDLAVLPRTGLGDDAVRTLAAHSSASAFLR